MINGKTLILILLIFRFRMVTFLAVLLMVYVSQQSLQSCCELRSKCLTDKLLEQGYRYHNLGKTFFKFYRRRYELISKFNVGLETLLREGLSEPECYGDLVYKFKKLKARNDFLQLRKIITRYSRIGYTDCTTPVVKGILTVPDC